LWFAIVSATLCSYVSDQVSASREIADELASMNCGDRVAAQIDCQAAASETYGGSWASTAATFVEFGFWPLCTYALAPPAIALVLGGAAIGLFRRRRAMRRVEILVDDDRRQAAPEGRSPAWVRARSSF
jgi:hypothetical protein